MNDAKRLSAQPESDFELRLLRAGRVEPPPGSKDQAILVASSVLAASILAAPGAAGGGAAAGGAKAAGLTALQWFAILMLVAAGVVAGVVAFPAGPRDPARPSAARIDAPPSATDSSEAVRRSNAIAEAVPAATDPATLPPFAREPVAASAAPRPSRPRSATGASTARSAKESPAAVASSQMGDAGTSSVAAELAMLDDVRRAVAANQLAHALSILDAYQARFPRGTMAAEATVLRIGVLERTGDHSSAKQLADTFLATHPDTLYVSRVKSLMAGSNP